MSSRNRLLLAAVAGLFPFVAFVDVRDHEFTLDSQKFLAHDQRVLEGEIGRIWATDYWDLQERKTLVEANPSLYRPLTLTVLAFGAGMTDPTDLRAGRSKPVNTLNLLFHALACAARAWLLLFLFGRTRYLTSVVMLASAALSVHPITSETVATQVGLAESLSLLFLLLAVIAALRPGIRPAAASLAATYLAMMAKENAVVAPALVFATLWIRRDLDWRAVLRRSVPAVLGVALALLQRKLVLGTITGVAEPTLEGFPFLPRIATACSTLWSYGLRAIFIPVRLHPNLMLSDLAPVPGFGSSRALLGLAVLIAVSVFAVRAFLRRAPSTAGWAFLLVPWLPVSHLLVPIGALSATRFFYAPLTGLAFLIVAALDRDDLDRPGRRVSVYTSLALVAALLLVAGRHEAAAWKSDDRLFTTALERYPESPFLLYNLGTRRAQAAVASGSKAALREAANLLAKAAAAPLPEIPCSYGLVPEDALELRFSAASNHAIAEAQLLMGGPVGREALDLGILAFKTANDLALETAQRGVEQSARMPSKTRWDTLLLDARLARAKFLAAVGAAAAHRRDLLMAEAQAILDELRNAHPAAPGVMLLAAKLASSRGDARAEWNAVLRVFEEHKDELPDDRSLRELGLELAGVLEKQGRADEAQAVRLSVLLAEPPPVAVEALLRHGVPGAASRSAATRALARRALEVALEDPVWPTGQDRARVADLLQKLKSGG